MKTLDEVIEAMERCSIPHYFDCKGCPYEDDDAEVGCRSDDKEHDALQYLKTYKDDKDALTALRAYRKEQQANPPLTWDELRMMEGKPVWVEPCKEWMLITEIETELHIWLLSLDGMDYDMSLHEWQAYRKER